MIKQKTYSNSQLVEMLKPITSYMTTEQLESLSNVCSIYEYGRDTYIYKEGDVADTVFFLMKGTAKVYMSEEGLQRQIMTILKSGDFFGHEASFSHQNHISSCAATQGAIVCTIPVGRLTEMLSTNHELMQYVLKSMSDALIMARLRYVRLTQKHVRGRLADTLLQLHERFGCNDDSMAIGIELSREELASIANMTTANAIRTLSAFVAENVITLNRRKIRITDINKLQNISLHD